MRATAHHAPWALVVYEAAHAHRLSVVLHHQVASASRDRVRVGTGCAAWSHMQQEGLH